MIMMVMMMMVIVRNFSFCVRSGWLATNPFCSIDFIVVDEKE